MPSTKITKDLISVRKVELICNAVVAIVRTALISGALVAVAVCAWRATVAVAGKETTVGFILSALGNAKIAIGANLSISLSLAVGLGLERRLRQKTIQRLQGRIRALERMVDLGRTSSGLDERGNTRREDR